MKRRLRWIAGTTTLIASALAYSCHASFSPDGKRLAFPYYSSDGKELAVGIYDRESGVTTRVLSLGMSEALLCPLWSGDGRRLFVPYKEKRRSERLRVTTLTPGDTTPPKTMGPFPSKDLFLQPPPLLGDRYLLLGADPIRLDLESGEVSRLEGLPSATLLGRGRQLFYLKTHDVEGDEVGTVVDALGKATSRRLTTLPPRGKEALPAAACVAPDGKRLAYSAPRGRPDGVLILGEDGSQSRLDLDRGQVGQLGAIAWSPDGKRLHAVSLKPAMSGEGQELGLCELPLERGAPRWVKVLDLHVRARSADSDQILLGFTLALAPDGKAAALTGTYVMSDKLPLADRGPFLVDLSAAASPVTRVPLPDSSGAPARR